MEPTIFEPRLKFKARLKFFEFGLSALKFCHHTGCVLYFPVLKSDLHSCKRFLCRGVLRSFCWELNFFSGGGDLAPIGAQNHLETIDFTDPVGP